MSSSLLKEEFEKDLNRLITEIIREVYKPLTFIKMVEKHGAIEATRRVVEDEHQTEGFLKLFMAKRVDLTVENMVCQS